MVPQMSTMSKVFGSQAFEQYIYDLMLLEAVWRRFNSRGYEKFRSLAKISKPKRREKSLKWIVIMVIRGRKRGVGKTEMGLLEVVTEEEDNGGDDLSSLLAEEFKAKNGTPNQVVTFGRAVRE
ncbi:unnamed protein product [Fraxinus pennsylvanica]|uniref:Uncharacterized protein n=1 Tax=Fraxinus pennsylvanica TaxID=56036 RepID=A0AAD2A844_9LAMI|nr:unnamed protein product [Fraxinus pennsylvanica]